MRTGVYARGALPSAGIAGEEALQDKSPGAGFDSQKQDDLGEGRG